MSSFEMRNPGETKAPLLVSPTNAATSLVEAPHTVAMPDSDLNGTANPLSLIQGKVERKLDSAADRPIFSERIAPVLITMMIFCFYPSSARHHTKFHFNIKDIFIHRNIYVGFLSFCAILFNGGFFIYNITGIHEMFMQQKAAHNFSLPFTDMFLDPVFVAQIINCQKPLVSCFNMLTFVVGIKYHRKMLKTLNIVDMALFDKFGTEPHLKTVNFIFIGTTLATFAIPLSVRIFQAAYMQEPLGQHWLSDLSYILVPLWATWNTLPTYYFSTINYIIIFWCKRLSKLILDNYKINMEQRSLKFYYVKYLEITDIQQSSQNFFGTFMFWSMTWSVFTLALAIYFVTQTSSVIPTNFPVEYRSVLIFIIAWTTLQVLTGIMNVLLICIGGIATNEAMRNVVQIVQGLATDIETDEDRYYADCFKNKIDLQHYWGVTIGGAFLLERSTLFTLFGVILSYSLLLVELKG